MRIREAAQQSGLTSSTIRFYEQVGLLGPVRRTAAGYRVFAERDVKLLIFLRKARDLGYSLDDCRDLLQVVTATNRKSVDNAARARALALKRLDEIEADMARLASVRVLIQLHLDTLDEVTGECPVTREL